MNVAGCQVVKRTAGPLGFSTQVTLQSPLSTEAAWERLREVLPRFDVPPEIPWPPQALPTCSGPYGPLSLQARSKSMI